MLEPGTLLQDRYRVVRHIGQGGMGAVYEAVDLRLGITVALKQTLLAGEHYMDLVAGQTARPSFSRTLSVETPRLSGDDVTAVQRRLLELGYSEVGEVDGLFGPNTESAVKRFQAANGLTVDGMVGPKMWEKLFGDNAR